MEFKFQHWSIIAQVIVSHLLIVYSGKGKKKQSWKKKFQLTTNSVPLINTWAHGHTLASWF